MNAKDNPITTLRTRAQGLLQRAVARADSWVNATTGLGTTRDKRMQGLFEQTLVLNNQELENLFDNYLARRIVSKIVTDALRMGFDVLLPNDGEEPEGISITEQEAAIQTALDDLTAIPKLGEAWIWGRLFGGAALYAITDDPGLPEEELDLDKIQSVDSLIVIDRRDIIPIEYDRDPKSVRLGEPLLYQINRPTPQGQVVETFLIHWSRLIIFEGKLTSWRRKSQNHGWSLSVLQCIHDVLRDFDTSMDAISALLQDASQGVFKMDGLIDTVASDGADAVFTRLAIADQARSTIRALVLDAEKEDFTRVATSFAGISDVCNKLMLRMSAAAEMPITVLFGQSPAGMDATGESDQTIWDDEIKSAQTHQLNPRLERLLLLLMSAKNGPTKGVVPEGWTIKHRPLRQMDEKQQSELRKKQAETDQIEINAGIVTPEEVALSRHPDTGWSPETKINLELRSEIQEADDAAAKKKLSEPTPTPPPQPPTPPAPAPDPNLPPTPEPEPGAE